MIHPSYADLMEVVNADVKEGEQPVINSRYSIVMATARRARQLVDGKEPLVETRPEDKPLSIAVEELNSGRIRILSEEERAAALAAEEPVISMETTEEESPAEESASAEEGAPAQESAPAEEGAPEEE